MKITVREFLNVYGNKRADTLYGYDDAFVGMDIEGRPVYDYTKMMAKLMNEGKSATEAVRFLDNVLIPFSARLPYPPVFITIRYDGSLED